MYYADSTMGSAPQLQTTSAGAMVAVLDACLVNGFGSYTAPGWGIAFTATNKRSYRAASGHRFYLNVDDTLTAQTNVRGYEVMTSTTAGTSPFPTTAQLSVGNSFWYKCTADAQASGSTNWWFYGSATFFHLIVNDTVSAGTYIYSFGDFPAVKTDSYNTLIGGVQPANQASGYTFTNYLGGVGTNASANIFMARSFDGTEKSIGLYPTSTLSNRSNAFGTGGIGVTQAQTDQCYASAIYLTTASDATFANAVIGRWPNIWNAMNMGDSYTATYGDYAIDSSYNASAKFHAYYDYSLGYYFVEQSTVGDL